MKYLLYIFIIMAAFKLKAQHSPMYSQYLLNGLAINPAYSGRNEALDLTLLHRQQWIGIDGAPVTTAFTANTPLRKKHIT